MTFVGVERIVGFVGVEFVVVHMVVGAHVLTTANLVKTGSLQFNFLRSAFSPMAQGLACPR